MFANAGVLGGLARTADYPRQTWDRVISINLGGARHSAQSDRPVTVFGTDPRTVQSSQSSWSPKLWTDRPIVVRDTCGDVRRRCV